MAQQLLEGRRKHPGIELRTERVNQLACLHAHGPEAGHRFVGWRVAQHRVVDLDGRPHVGSCALLPEMGFGAASSVALNAAPATESDRAARGLDLRSRKTSA